MNDHYIAIKTHPMFYQLNALNAKQQEKKKNLWITLVE